MTASISLSWSVIGQKRRRYQAIGQFTARAGMRTTERPEAKITIGWRETCLAWAALHVVIGIPLSASLPRAAAADWVIEGHGKPHLPMDPNMWLLAFAFAAGWTISTAMAAHLPRILQAAGATEAQAIGAGVLIGPAQVAARLIEAGPLEAISSPVFGSPFRPLASCWRRDFGAWRRRGASIHPSAWGRKRHFDDCAWHSATRALWAGELRISLRHSWRARPDIASRSAPSVQSAHSAFGRSVLVISGALGVAALAAFCLVNTSRLRRS